MSISSNTSASQPVGSSLCVRELGLLEILEETDDVGMGGELLQRRDLAQALDLEEVRQTRVPGRDCRSGSSCT